MRRVVAALAMLIMLAAAGCASSTTPSAGTDANAGGHAPRTSAAAPAPRPAATPHYRFAHVVVVMEENHGYDQIIGNPDASYMNALARSGLLLTDSHAITHPSQPNYLALFSGSTYGVTGDSCPQTLPHRNLGSQLRAAGLSFTGYSEKLPSVGSTTCIAGPYARRHVPWTDFPDLPASVNRPLGDFPTDFAKLPTVSFVIPDVDHDMHDGTIAQADGWLHTHLFDYAHWARTHHSLLIVTWDEDDNTAANHIATIAFGDGVAAGRYGHPVNHYRLLRTLEAMYHLTPLANAAKQSPIGPLAGS